MKIILATLRYHGYCVLLLLVLLNATVQAQSVGIQIIATVENHAVIASKPATIWINLLNSSDAPITASFHNAYDCTLRCGSEMRSARLDLMDVNAPQSTLLPADGFARRKYRLDVPPDLIGETVVEIPQIPGVRLVLEVGSPGGTTQIAAPTRPRVRPSDPVRFFKEHFFPHEPIYFIAGLDSPNAKFQVSLKYRLLDPESLPAEWFAPLGDLYAAYSQTSLWDWNTASAPFFDSSYRPEFLYYRENILHHDDWLRFDLQSGARHESNGRDGENSRSMNTVYLQPSLVLGNTNSIQLTFTPRAWIYVGDLSDNPDIERYRGYVDLRVALNLREADGVPAWLHNTQLAAWARCGNHLDRGSLQLDFTYPLWNVPWLNSSVFLHVQWFTGYGESLLDYNERVQQVRAGFSLFR